MPLGVPIGTAVEVRSRAASLVRCSSDFSAAAVERAWLTAESSASRAIVRRSSIVGIFSSNSRLSPRCAHGELSTATIFTCSASPGLRPRGPRSSTAVPSHTADVSSARRCTTAACGPPAAPCFHDSISMRVIPWSSLADACSGILSSPATIVSVVGETRSTCGAESGTTSSSSGSGTSEICPDAPVAIHTYLAVFVGVKRPANE